MNIMKINNWKIPAAIVLLVLSASLLIGCSTNSGTDANIASSTASAVRTPPNGQVQVVKLSVDSNFIYSPQEIRIKAGTKLRIEADPKTNVGGMDTVIVDDYKVSKKITSEDNVLEFIADTPGTFKIHCANGMGDGQLIVEP